MAGKVLNIINWSGTRDEEGHREYSVTILVESLKTDGPQTVTFSPGLPTIGSPWTFGNDNDPWAFCTPFLKITPRLTEEPNKHWEIEYKFTTKPMRRCNDTLIENPLLEPVKISGSFVNGTKEVQQDRNGNVIKTTSHEPVSVEFDDNLANVRIEQNVAILGLATFTPLVNTVNSVNMWGLGPRKVKLSNVSWQRHYYGICSVYYSRVFDFDVNFNTFDRSDIPNKGRRVLRGDWDDGGLWVLEGSPSQTNPTDFIEAFDKNGNPTEQFLDSNGEPTDLETFIATVEYYSESNFLSTLNLPATL